MAENAIKQTGNDLPTTPEQLLAAFDTLGLSYSVHEHEPTFTVAESEYLKAHIAGAHCRNLFVRDKKHEMFLVVAQNETAIDLKKLQILRGLRISGMPEFCRSHCQVQGRYVSLFLSRGGQ